MRVEGPRQEREIPLSSAPLGSPCRITRLAASGLTRRRLLDIGLVPGACVSPVRRSPAGDPTAYSVKDTLVALRAEEASQVIVLSRLPSANHARPQWR